MITIKGEIHSSKNSRQIVRPVGGSMTYIVKSKASKKDEKSMDIQLCVQQAEWESMTAGKTYPLHVVFHFVRKTKRKWDFVNLVQGVADAMVKAGYIPDDDVDHLIPVFGGYTVDKDNPGVDIWIAKIKAINL